MTPDELKHMDYIQSTISRMASSQFQIKGWCITINTAILTLFANSLGNPDGINPYFLLMAVFPTTLFWIMDARFLANERRLRSVYSEVAKHNEDIAPFDMPLHRYKKGKNSLLRCMFSFSNVLIYLVCNLVFLVGFVAFLIYKGL